MQNFHPLFVHFPIALLLTSVAAAFVAALTKKAGADTVARVLLYLGTLAAGVTALTGFFAAQTVAPVARARPVLGEHQTYAYILLAVAAILSAWSIVAWRRLKRPPRPTAFWLVGQLALAVLIALTANEGGELVHEYGVGTKMTAKGGPLHEAGNPGGAPADTSAPRPTGRDFR
jgi:uncharacterized membrane protein